MSFFFFCFVLFFFNKCEKNYLFLLGVALLPFVDERRLRAALEEVYPDLTPEESKNCDILLQLVLTTVFPINEQERYNRCLVGLNYGRLSWFRPQTRTQAVASSSWMLLVIRIILDGFVFVAFTYFLLLK